MILKDITAKIGPADKIIIQEGCCNIYEGTRAEFNATCACNDEDDVEKFLASDIDKIRACNDIIYIVLN